METAGLTDLLKQEGSYTIFAPTDEAFESLSKEDFELLKRECCPKSQTESTSSQVSFCGTRTLLSQFGLAHYLNKCGRNLEMSYKLNFLTA